MRRKVVVTGMGCISGLGLGLPQTWSRVSQGQGAIRTSDEVADEASSSGDAGAISGPIARLDRDELEEVMARTGRNGSARLDPVSAWALIATQEAIEAAGLADHPALSAETAVIMGCGSGGNATLDAAYSRIFSKGSHKVHPQTIPRSMVSAPASQVAMLLGVHGPCFVLSSACASSAHAIGEAAHMVRGGRVEVAIAGGSEACLSQGPWIAWNSLGVLAPDTCRPFSIDRQGMVLGEGAAAIVLESEEHARARGARILGELAGYGASSDAVDITAPDQSGIQTAIEAAHRDADVSTGVPALISAHGTGTRLNDPVEAAAMKAVYGAALANHTVIATKSAHGHLIGATAAIEFVIGMKALAEGLAPPVLNHCGTDPECDLPLALEPTPIDHEVLVSNSFAFGGLNAVLIGRRQG